MDNPDDMDLPKPAEIEARLRTLTPRQREILHLLCQAKSREWIAENIGWPVPTTKRDIGIIYEKLGLDHLSREERRFWLARLVCPVHDRLLEDATTGYKQPSEIPGPPILEIPEPPPKPATQELVEEDEKYGVIPVDRSLIPRWPISTEVFPTMLQKYPNEWRSRANPLPWILVGVLGTLLVVVSALALVLLTRPPGPSALPTVAAAVDTPIPTRTAQVVPPTPTPTVPAPTPTRNVTVVPAGPLILTATPSSNQQVPSPGSIIPAGQSYTRNGVTITLKKSLYLYGSIFSFYVEIENQSGQQVLILWHNSMIHVRDNAGKSYRPYPEVYSYTDWDRNKQFAISVGTTQRLDADLWNSDSGLAAFLGPISPNAKQLIVTIDQMAGMTNMSWRFDVQP